VEKGGRRRIKTLRLSQGLARTGEAHSSRPAEESQMRRRSPREIDPREIKEKKTWSGDGKTPSRSRDSIEKKLAALREAIGGKGDG